MYRVVGVGAALNLAVNWMGRLVGEHAGPMVLSSLVTTLLARRVGFPQSKRSASASL